MNLRTDTFIFRRKYYERNNFLIAQYLYIDRLLDSSLPRDLIEEYHTTSNINLTVPPAIAEENSRGSSLSGENSGDVTPSPHQGSNKVKRTPRNIYKVPQDERTLLLGGEAPASHIPEIDIEQEEETLSGDKVVTVAIYLNLVANVVLLIGKIIVMLMTSSVSILASLVDAALDFLSTAIVWTTTKLIARQDQYRYPVGRRRLEPIGVLVFSVIMIASFFQVALECITRLSSHDHAIVSLSLPAILIMASTVVVKFLCWLWCRLINNSSVQALAQDAETDIVFNIFSIIFPLSKLCILSIAGRYGDIHNYFSSTVGFYAQIWWLDALGGLLLSLYVICGWSATSSQHIKNLTGAAATADQRNILLYLTMRFAKTIKQIQGLQAYHAGDKLNVEVDIVLDEHMSLRDSHDLSESLQYVLESVPMVDRAFVHSDYLTWNLPTHMSQQE